MKRRGQITAAVFKVGVSGLVTAVLGVGASNAIAANYGTDMNLTYKPAAGGMAGAAYAAPQEASAAVFGNPATLTQFIGFNANLGASWLKLDLENTQTTQTTSHTSHSSADNYIIPDFALSYEIEPGLVAGGGLEVNAGIGTDFRQDPIHAAGGAITIPLNVELLSFNANAAVAKKISEQTSIGGALTIGFGLAQLGTTGNTTGISSTLGSLGLSDFGGTTSSVHDISLGGSLGITHQLTKSTLLSFAVKSPLKYKFDGIAFTTVGGSAYQTLEVEQPLQLTAGAAFQATPKILLELDGAWKNWANAKAYQDVWKNQWILATGAQYTVGALKIRGGYCYSSDLMRDDPNGTIGGLKGVGTLPLNFGVPGLLASNDLMKIVQTTLVPVVWQHQLSAGLGYDLNAHVRFDAYANHAFSGSVTRSTVALGTYEATLSSWSVGGGVAFRF